MGRSKRYNNEAKKEDRKVSIYEPERKVVQAKILKRPSSKKEEHIRIIAQAARITEAHKTLDCG
jgi:hypothetical protein